MVSHVLADVAEDVNALEILLVVNKDNIHALHQTIKLDGTWSVQVSQLSPGETHMFVVTAR